MLVKYADFDPVEDKYMAISVNYRGEIKSKEANATVQWLKQNNKISFVEWCPTGFKIGLNEKPATIVADDVMAPAKRNVTMIGNSLMNGEILTMSTLLLAAMYFLMAAKEDPLDSFKALTAATTITALGGCSAFFAGFLALATLGAAASTI